MQALGCARYCTSASIQILSSEQMAAALLFLGTAQGTTFGNSASGGLTNSLASTHPSLSSLPTLCSMCPPIPSLSNQDLHKEGVLLVITMLMS